MITAKDMRKVATEYHEVIDEDFLSNMDSLIKISAERGQFVLEVDITNINASTFNKFKSCLRENGFKVEVDILQSRATISW